MKLKDFPKNTVKDLLSQKPKLVKDQERFYISNTFLHMRIHLAWRVDNTQEDFTLYWNSTWSYWMEMPILNSRPLCHKGSNIMWKTNSQKSIKFFWQRHRNYFSNITNTELTSCLNSFGNVIWAYLKWYYAHHSFVSCSIIYYTKPKVLAHGKHTSKECKY